MIQNIIVGLFVAMAAVVVIRRYSPGAAKRAVRIGVGRLAGALGWNTLAQRLALQAEAVASCGTGCGSCGNCASSANDKGAAEQSVSVESLKRTLRR